MKIIIIGASTPGLFAAFLLARSGADVEVYERSGKLESVGTAFYATRAHTIAVDSTTHEVYVPLENVVGKPVLRILVPK